MSARILREDHRADSGDKRAVAENVIGVILRGARAVNCRNDGSAVGGGRAERDRTGRNGTKRRDAAMSTGGSVMCEIFESRTR